VTISEAEAGQLVAEHRVPVAREAAQGMLNYIIFHRSLLSETEQRPELLDRYMELVSNLKKGVHIVIQDPFQKATALLFELVMDNEFDPWEIDLVRFTEVYLERVRSEGGIDFAVAGRLLYMAWNILYLQSQEVLSNRDRPKDDELPAEDPSGLDDGYLGEIGSPTAIDVTDTVLQSIDGPALTPMISHPETRPVSLLELVNAFGEAEQEARRALRIEELRERLREEQRAPPEVLVHGDIPERDLLDVWETARNKAKGEPFPFLDLWTKLQGRDRLVELFLAVLFLARERVVDLVQEKLGDSPLFLVRREDERPLPNTGA
jgi:segregation and condensation protein A